MSWGGKQERVSYSYKTLYLAPTRAPRPSAPSRATTFRGTALPPHDGAVAMGAEQGGDSGDLVDDMPADMAAGAIGVLLRDWV
jgi:hypothetical protein